MFDFRSARIGHFLVEWFGSFHSRTADGLFAGRFVFLQRDLREIGGCFVILVLRPTFKGMIVAFIAVESNA